MRRLVALAAALLPLSAVSAERLELFHDRLFVAVTVNGIRTAALLDSAAELTVLDDDFARRLGLTVAGAATAHGSGASTMAARFADHVRIAAAGVSLEEQVAVLDLGEVSGRLIGRPVDLLLGRELFDNGRLRIDIAGGTIARTDRAPHGVRLPLSEHRGTPAIPASIEGLAPTQAVFDLGNGSDVLIGRAYAELAGLTAPGRIVAHEAGGGLGGARPRDIVMLRRLTLAGRTFRNIRAAIDPGETASDLNLGTRILRHFLIVTDFPRGAIWLEPRR
jgi:predicted aspartyl protease